MKKRLLMSTNYPFLVLSMIMLILMFNYYSLIFLFIQLFLIKRIDSRYFYSLQRKQLAFIYFSVLVLFLFIIHNPFYYLYIPLSILSLFEWLLLPPSLMNEIRKSREDIEISVFHLTIDHKEVKDNTFPLQNRELKFIICYTFFTHKQVKLSLLDIANDLSVKVYQLKLLD